MIAYLRATATFCPEVSCGDDGILRSGVVVVCVVCAGGDYVVWCREGEGVCC